MKCTWNRSFLSFFMKTFRKNRSYRQVVTGTTPFTKDKMNIILAWKFTQICHNSELVNYLSMPEYDFPFIICWPSRTYPVWPLGRLFTNVGRILWCKLWIINIYILQAYWLPLQWRHNKRDGILNHQPHDCLLNRLFRRRSKNTSKLRVTGNSPVTGEFLAQRASNAELFPFDDVIMQTQWTYVIK